MNRFKSIQMNGVAIFLLAVITLFIGAVSVVQAMELQELRREVVELQEVNENQWHMISSYFGFCENSEFDDRISKLEEKHWIEIVKIEDGRIDELWFEVFGGQYGTVIVEDFQSKIDWLEDDINNLYDKVDRINDDLSQICVSPCRRDKIITPGGYYDLITP